MTWSIIARDPKSGGFGAAVASRFFAVGALCPYLEGGVGAICSQALVNPYLGIQGLRLLADGMPAVEVQDVLIAGDEGREARQFHVIDAEGRNAAHTGGACVDWAGHIVANNVSVAGNMLVDEVVIEDTLQAYEASHSKPMAERLLMALQAGDKAGGDKRGKQAAALVVVSTEAYADLNIRVDDHPEPIEELCRLYQVAHERYIPYRSCMPTRANPAGVYDRLELDARIESELMKQDAFSSQD